MQSLLSCLSSTVQLEKGSLVRIMIKLNEEEADVQVCMLHCSLGTYTRLSQSGGNRMKNDRDCR